VDRDDVVILAGLALLVGGVCLLSFAAGAIVGGLAVIGIGMLRASTRAKAKGDRR
jgi:hypothetical protein